MTQARIRFTNFGTMTPAAHRYSAAQKREHEKFSPALARLGGDLTLDVGISVHEDVISLSESWADAPNRVSMAVLDLKERAVREALIKLGWTPPAPPPVAHEPKEALHGHF